MFTVHHAMPQIFTVKTNKEFSDAVIDHSRLLDDAINWVESNLEIGDVYSERDVINYIRNSSLVPEDLFSSEDLESWAESNGYVKFFG